VDFERGWNLPRDYSRRVFQMALTHTPTVLRPDNVANLRGFLEQVDQQAESVLPLAPLRDEVE
jgi:hypothetical protein